MTDQPAMTAATCDECKAASCAGGCRCSCRKPPCGKFVYWWDGEYEGNCELPEGHEGDHFDGLSWFNDDNESRDHAH